MLAAKGQHFAGAHHSPPARNGAAATMIGILVNPEFPDTTIELSQVQTAAGARGGRSAADGLA